MVSAPSTVDPQIFREDGGRKYNASNEAYALPADEEERTRLNIQHEGWKAVNGGKNYLAPIDKVLINEGEGKRVLDIGTGTGIWAEEIAQEFPKADVIGLDLVPYDKGAASKPPNFSIVLADCAKGLPFPDGHFDVVHARLIVAGIRDWPSLLSEAVRITKPGGLVNFAEGSCTWPIIGPIPQGVGQGYITWLDFLTRACENKGCDVHAGEVTIPRVLGSHPDIKDVQSKYIYLPFHPWSSEPDKRAAGEIMIEDAKLLPDALRSSIMDLGVSAEQYAELKQAYVDDLSDERVHSAMPMWHNWGWKI